MVTVGGGGEAAADGGGAGRGEETGGVEASSPVRALFEGPAPSSSGGALAPVVARRDMAVYPGL